MAIIRSVAVGKARKSVGNVTFRTVRGRTIASEKRGPNPGTRPIGVSVYQFNFALLSRFVRMHRIDIDLSFNKSKFGSQGNEFQKKNAQSFAQAFAPLFQDNIAPGGVSDAEISAAVTTFATANPTAIYRVLKTGAETKYLTGDWSSSDNPIPQEPATVSAISYNGAPKEAGFAKFTILSDTPMKLTGSSLSASRIYFATFPESKIPTTGFESADKVAELQVATDTPSELVFSYGADLADVKALAVYDEAGKLLKSIVGTA